MPKLSYALHALAISLSISLLGACAPSSAAIGGDWKTTAQPIDDWRDEVIYQVLTDRFADGDESNDYNIRPGELGRYQGGDWQGLIDHLDYFKALGVTTLWISPVVRNLESDSGFDSYHGYWQQDMSRENPHFGDIGALRRLSDAVHAAGMKIVLDIVVNHVAQLFYYDINGNGQPDVSTYGSGCGEQPPANTQSCPTPAVITYVNEYDPPYNANGILGYSSLGFSGPAPVRWIYDGSIDREPTLPGSGAAPPGEDQNATLFQRRDWYHMKGDITDYGQPEQVVTGDFPGGLKDLATERTDVQEALTAVFANWIQKGDFDGFRIDTLKHVDHGFWQAFCAGIRKYVAGESIPDPAQGPNATVTPLTVPKQKFFMYGESFDGDDVLDGSFTVPGEVDAVVHFPQKFAVFDAVFKANGPTQAIQDQLTRVAMDYGSVPQTGGVGVPPQDTLVNFLDNHDVARFLFDKPSVPALHNALSYLLTEPGVPCIYYGTEQEFDGGNDPTNRELMWPTGYATTGATFKFIQLMIRIRKAYAPLRTGAMTVRWATTRVAMEQDAGIFAFERSLNGHTVLVIVNTSDLKTSETSATQVGGGPMTVGFPEGTVLDEVFSQDPTLSVTVGTASSVTVSVPSRGVKIFAPHADVVPVDHT